MTEMKGMLQQLLDRQPATNDKGRILLLDLVVGII